MKLEDIVPENPSFTLSATGRTYELRPPSLEDIAHWTRTYGGIEGLTKVFKDKDWPEMCKVCFRLMKDKSDFMAKKEIVIDDDGIETEKLVLAPERLFKAIATLDEGVAFQSAINKAFEAAQPKQANADQAQGTEKKSDPSETSTGQKSSSSSQRSTGTRRSNSEASQAERSLS